MKILVEQYREYERRQAHVREGYKTASDSKARKAAKRAGLRVVKVRGRLHSNNLGGFQLIDGFNNVVAGNDFDMSTRDVVDYCESQIKSHSDAMANKLTAPRLLAIAILYIRYMGETTTETDVIISAILYNDATCKTERIPYVHPDQFFQDVSNEQKYGWRVIAFQTAMDNEESTLLDVMFPSPTKENMAIVAAMCGDVVIQ